MDLPSLNAFGPAMAFVMSAAAFRIGNFEVHNEIIMYLVGQIKSIGGQGK